MFNGKAFARGVGVALWVTVCASSEPALTQNTPASLLPTYSKVQEILTSRVVQINLMPNNDPVDPPILKEGKRLLVLQMTGPSKVARELVGTMSPTEYAFVEAQRVVSVGCELHIFYQTEGGKKFESLDEGKSDDTAKIERYGSVAAIGIAVDFSKISKEKIFTGGEKVYLYGKKDGGGVRLDTQTISRNFPQAGVANGIAFTMQSPEAAQSLGREITLITQACEG